MNEYGLIATILVAPLVGFLVNGFGYRRLSCMQAGTIASVMAALSFFFSVVLCFYLIQLPHEQRTIVVHFFDWISVGSFTSSMRFLIDPISIVMILVVTGVGTLIHVYSVGYMQHDDSPARYFAYLNLFLFNMLILVLADNLLVMFIGWEGVGLCSYLLIGFWFSDQAKAIAGMKAFITNRIGDAALLLGIFLIFVKIGSVDFSEINGVVRSDLTELWWIQVACLLLFIGATGKSAQIPLYVWLPDAMAGPTPVSALIHAATMVTAGVYLVVRLNAFYLLAPNVLFLIAVIGLATAFFAATVALTQWDIKKILAYSTISQLGFMFLAVGVGAFRAALFHLVTHAFFKALLFLGAGSVIHAMHEQQDIRKMGGLRHKMPITYITFLIAWLAIIGVPPLAGFFSKDEILWLAYQSPLGNIGFWIIGVFGAVLTAFYMTRLMALTFWGEHRWDEGARPHESNHYITIPLMTLSLLCVFGGWIGLPHIISSILPGHLDNIFARFLDVPFIAILPLGDESVLIEWALMGISLSLIGIASWLAYELYISSLERLEQIVRAILWLQKVVKNRYWVDEFYELMVINPIKKLSGILWYYIDVGLIDKTTYVVADFCKGSGMLVRIMQNGSVQQYAFYIIFGIVVVFYLVFRG